jgi:hypothetical protein
MRLVNGAPHAGVEICTSAALSHQAQCAVSLPSWFISCLLLLLLLLLLCRAPLLAPLAASLMMTQASWPAR